MHIISKFMQYFYTYIYITVVLILEIWYTVMLIFACLINLGLDMLLQKLLREQSEKVYMMIH